MRLPYGSIGYDHGVAVKGNLNDPCPSRCTHQKISPVINKASPHLLFEKESRYDRATRLEHASLPVLEETRQDSSLFPIAVDFQPENMEQVTRR